MSMNLSRAIEARIPSRNVTTSSSIRVNPRRFLMAAPVLDFLRLLPRNRVIESMTGAPAAIRPPVRRDGIPAAAALRSPVPARPRFGKRRRKPAVPLEKIRHPLLLPEHGQPDRGSATAADSGGSRFGPASQAGCSDQEQQPAQSEQAEDAHPLADLRLHAARGRLPGLLVALLDHRLRRFQQVGLAVVRRRRAESGHPGSLVSLGWPASTRATWSGKLAMSIGLVM